MLLLTSVLSAAIVGAIGYQSGRSSLRDAAFERLTELREAYNRQLATQFDDLEDSLVIYTRGSTAINAMREFSRGFAELRDTTITPAQQQSLVDYYEDQFKPKVDSTSDLEIDIAGLLPQSNAQKYLQAHYTAPYDTVSYALDLDDARDGSMWSTANARYTDFFREVVSRFEFEDALLIDTNGTVVYTAYKGVDLGTNIHHGPYRNHELEDAFERAVATNTVDYVEVTDFSEYLPSYNEPTAWLLSPIGEPGRIEGVLALQYPITKINRLMTADRHWENVGMGSTGEALLAGPDGLMRSDSRVFLEDPERYRQEVVAAGTPREVADRAIRSGGTTLVQPIHSEGVTRAQRGEVGTVVTEDYLGNKTLQAYAPVDIRGLNWSLIAKVDTAEAFAPVADFTRRLVLSTVAIIFLVCLASMFLARMFVRPIRRLEAGAQRISGGDYNTTLPVLSRDEFGDLTAAFNDMTRNLRVKEDLINEQRKENNRLLLSLMPESVAQRYREGEEMVPQEHRDVTVVFADIVGLDELSTTLSSDDLLGVVNRLVRQFDAAAESIGVERVRTMRSGYLASCGLNVPRLDSTRRTVDFAIEMAEIIERFNAETGHHLALRAGIDTGSVTSGLVGRTNVIYDLWGAAVNLAYQAQSGPGQPGIYVTSAVYEMTREFKSFVSAGEVPNGGPDGADGEPLWRLTEKN
ncbi:adenylate/guanylate cyclase domain-containing protein [Mycolicibacterium confluentis]|uniref:Adenylate/guanylate cyclase domain-containing protein n=2 Tax=Mycolicibacterium confluentis TaxID=28047 RepID=A0A7I7XWY1_9MYCO|nr:adenylate/guanylate cyclase domain-containing protein [Mycolicibacterium confluentis]